MKKITKLSLVAAVAVAGLTSASAKPLEEAIKNVDVSGSVVYRYDNFDDSKASRTDNNNYKIGVNLSSKVNDYVKFNARTIVGSKDHGGFAALSAKDGGADGQADVSVSNAYFGLNVIPNTTVNIGKQGLATPYTKALDINGNEQTGTGILAISSLGMFTVGAGYFNNSNLNKSTEINGTMGFKTTTVNNGIVDGGKDIGVVTAQADFDVVKVELWGLNIANTLATYTVAVNGNYNLAEDAKVGFDARYVNLNQSNVEDDSSLIKLAVDGKFGIVNAKLGYAQTDKKGGLTSLDQDGQNTTLGWGISINGLAKATHIQAAVGLDILDNLNFTVNYGTLESKADGLAYSYTNNGKLKMEEVYGQLTYKMSKNLTTYVRYGTLEQKQGGTKEMDQNRGRLQVAYTF
ncbi:porin [Aliarcobacter thereius]|uniref:Major outer membrane protein n=1 Tax=Aliarcobacter thereius LMG 24486 TaxID=1032240 RepID=A0A1C7WSV7_9BACT|nr:porin [Aliarcobacter thereius]OCL96443.1 Major outer membrane protein precursor [Aliarcobacter thereius LMG 24486]QBF15596.1 major outer membrane protein [Aliarcobacter thereius LMG 24486]TLS91691.1 porin [Aliarcobacter thereius]